MNYPCMIASCRNLACLYCDCEMLLCGDHKTQHNTFNPTHKAREIFSKVQPKLKATLVSDMQAILEGLQATSQDFLAIVCAFQKSINAFCKNFLQKIDPLRLTIEKLISEMVCPGYHLNESHVSLIESILSLRKINFKEMKTLKLDFYEDFVKDSILNDAENFMKRCLTNIRSSVCEVCNTNKHIILRNCGHMGCLSCIQQQKLCSKCIKDQGEGFNADDMFCNCGSLKRVCLYCPSRICGNCSLDSLVCEKCSYSLNDCRNCGKKSQPVKLKCMHIGCTSCSKQGICNNCIADHKVCKNCQSPCFIIGDFKCGHNGCEKCIYTSCVTCSKPAHTRTESYERKHKSVEEGLITKGEFKCDNCGSLNAALNFRPCGHRTCERCNKDYCKTCSMSFGSAYFCRNCNKKGAKIILSCGHEGCYSCASSNYCKFCAESCCGNCGKSKYAPKLLLCSHPGCEGCELQFCKSCLKFVEFSACYNCQKITPTMKKLKCSHNICTSCFNKNPNCRSCSLPPSKPCIACNISTSDYVELPCMHPLCLVCYSKDSNCSKCTITKHCEMCVNCEILNAEYIKMKCGHFNCFHCIEKSGTPDYCRHCKATPTTSECSNCKSKNISKLQRCSHPLCVTCIEKLSCVKCESALGTVKCSCCEQWANNSTVMSCGHKGCFNCIQKLNPCKECRKSIRATCSNCKKPKEKLNTNPCGHQICYECDTGEEPCKICIDEQQAPIICNKCLGNFANSQFPCGHFICKLCKLPTNACPVCTNTSKKQYCRECPNCCEQTLNLKDFKCAHKGCSSCIVNMYCFDCIFVRKKHVAPVKSECKHCVACNKKTGLYSNLLCGHIVCDGCISENFKNINYFCIECLFNKSKICLKCKKKSNWIKIDNYAYSNCCQMSYCLKCLKRVESDTHKCELFMSIFNNLQVAK